MSTYASFPQEGRVGNRSFYPGDPQRQKRLIGTWHLKDRRNQRHQATSFSELREMRRRMMFRPDEPVTISLDLSVRHESH